MLCVERLHALKGIDTDFGEILKKLDDIRVLGTNRSFKPPTLLRKRVNDFDSMYLSTPGYDR